MAQLARSFNPQDHDTEQKEFSLLPEGIYSLEVESSKENDKNNDNYFRLDVVYNVREPEEFAGRKIFDGFNLVHNNPEAERISNEQFASLCRAIGHVGPVDESEVLHLLPFTAKVRVKPASKGKDGKEYSPKNVVGRFYFPDEGEIPAPEITGALPAANDNKQTTTAARPAAAAPKPAGSRPWGAKK